ncbi:MAG: DUF1549 and DUF1553 domain-containing protein [Pirellulales bacterium]
MMRSWRFIGSLWLLLTTLAIGIHAAQVFAADTSETASHWAFQPITGLRIPTVDRNDWIRTPIDAFILARQKQAGIEPSPPADRVTLLRRLSLNLWGLPLSRQQVSEFTSDTEPGAFDRLVERMLSSPHYGERWGRHWLDVARFAESTGFVENHDQPHFWRYRDWVVDSFNRDKPYDRFLTQQLAGDELEPYSDENIIATGFLAAARLATEELSCVRQENDMYVDIVNATSSAMLGLTMACAQCHDHRFDPITERDYYRLQAFFIRGYPGNLVLQSSPPQEAFHQSVRKWTKAKLDIRARIIGAGYDEQPPAIRRILHASAKERSPQEEAMFRVHRARLNIRIAGCNGFRITEDEKKRLDALRAEINKNKEQVTQTWGFYSPITSPHALSVLPMAGNFPLIMDTRELAERKAYLLNRGDTYQPKETVTPGFPEFLASGKQRILELRPRTALAQWITDPTHPLTARVWVNRIWSYHFGRSLVATPGNFGLRGATPTHPQLLDYLARQLIESGWSTKHIQRLIVKSNTYRQSSRVIRESPNRKANFRLVASDDPSPAVTPQTVDPDNHLYWRWPRRRLEAETVRDVMLAVSGKLDKSIGGPSVPVGQSSDRRSLYLFQKRDQPNEVIALFGGPSEMSASCAQRQVSTSPLQPLFLLNSPNGVAWAEAFAATVRKQSSSAATNKIELAFLLALGRSPDGPEMEAALKYLTFAQEESNLAWRNRVPHIVRVDVAPAEPPSLGGAAVLQSGEIGKYILHANGYADHTPDPTTATVTYYFDTAQEIAEVELIMHTNGVSCIEGFIGEDVDHLTSLGEASSPYAVRGKPFATEHGSCVFAFDPVKLHAGRVFRLVVKETIKADGFANYEAYPRDPEHRRIPPTAELVPGSPEPMSGLAKLCQAVLNLNELFYIP